MADGFLGRWSRRKQEAAAGRPLDEPARPSTSAPTAAAAALPPSTSVTLPVPQPQPVQAPAPEAAAAEPPPPTLADAQALTPDADFKPFIARHVAPEVRNAALKKLFADPHFNVMDGLDVYIDDYSLPDPLAPSTLQKMASAQFLGFFDDDPKPGAGDAAPCAPDAALTQAAPIAPTSSQPRAGTEAEPPPAVAQSGVCTALPTPPGEAESASPPTGGPVLPASLQAHDHADLRLQPDHAPQRSSVGRGAQ